MTRILEYQITEQFHNITIGNYLKTLGFSHQCVIALKKQEKGILLNGIWAYVNTPLSEGDTLTLTLSEKDSSEKIPYTIVISALNSEVITQKALQLGASYYLIKPFQLDHLADRIQMLVKPDSTFSSYTDTDSDSDLSALVTRHLIETGISTHVVGYRYCVQAIEMILKQLSYCPLMKCVYPVIAEKNNTTVPCVESAIRKAIATIPDIEWNQLSNRTFLSRMAEQIRIKYQLFIPDEETRSLHE